MGPCAIISRCIAATSPGAPTAYADDAFAQASFDPSSHVVGHWAPGGVGLGVAAEKRAVPVPGFEQLGSGA